MKIWQLFIVKVQVDAFIQNIWNYKNTHLEWIRSSNTPVVKNL